MTLAELCRLSGITTPESRDSSTGSNISVTGTEKAKLQRRYNIEPGTPEWFQLWFSLPYLTGEKPIGHPRSRK